MAVYTVHEPLPRKDEASADPERFVFVRDGFYFWAFVLGPLWMLWRRLWLVTLLYIAVSIGVQLGLWALNASDDCQLYRLVPVRAADRIRGGHLAPLDADPARLEKCRRRRGR